MAKQKPQFKASREQISLWWLAGMTLSEVLRQPLSHATKKEVRQLYSKRAVQQTKIGAVK